MLQAVCEMNVTYPPSGVQQEFGLSPRERRVVALVGQGYSNKELAQELGISENTAKHHLTSVFDKLSVVNRLELVLFAIDQGLNFED
jgi:DNA-binding CsgD family transcriptional regulator